MHVIVFPGWYPSRVDTLTGDFIQRHMQAIALKCEVTVIFAVKDNSVVDIEKLVQKKDGLTEIYIYYPSVTPLRWLESLFSFIRYTYACLVITKATVKKNKIDVAQLYVLQKNLLLGLLLKVLFKIPYVISEQSTFYVDGRFERMNFFMRRIYKWVFDGANSIHAVSNFLLRNVRKKLKLKVEGVVIPNVVDTNLFCYKQKDLNRLATFVHVSNMVHQKNVEGMLQAFAEVKLSNDRFILNLVGPVSYHIPHLIEQLHLSDNVILWKEKSYAEVAEIMKQSDVFVLFSRYETFGCVIIEANACGLPVIVSEHEVTQELVNDEFNGLFVENGNVKDLARKILDVISSRHKFDQEKISVETRERFNYERVASQFSDWYNSII